MSQKAFENGQGKMTASTPRTGRMSALLGILGAMVRGGQRKDARRRHAASGIAVPRGVSVASRQSYGAAGGDLRLLQ